MKLDKKYWYETYWSVVNAESEQERTDILKQIAEDAFAAGAEAQKVEDRTVIEFLHDSLEDLFIEGQQYEIDCESGNAGNMEESINRARIKIAAAINSATVKWEDETNGYV